MLAALAVGLTIQVCMPGPPAGLLDCWPFPVRSFQPYQDRQLCVDARDQGIADGTWVRAARNLNVPPGAVLRLTCPKDVPIPAGE